MNKRNLAFLIGTAFLLINTAFLSAQKGPGTEKMSDRPAVGILNLTDQQKEEMKKLHMTHMKEMQPLKNEMGELRARHKTLTSAENTNLAEINKNIDSRTALMGKMMKSGTAHQQAVRKILTDEQRFFLDNRPSKNGKQGFKPGAGAERGQGFGPGRGAGRMGQGKPGQGRLGPDCPYMK